MKDHQKYLEEINALFENNLSEKISFGRFIVDSYEKHMKYNFKTDMHWNCEGAYKGYLEVRELLRISENPVEITGEYVMENIHFVGSSSSAIGNSKRFDTFNLFSFNLPPYAVYVKGKKASYGHKQAEYDTRMSLPDKTNPYNYFFGSNFGEVIYDFSNNKKNLLMVVESYSNPINELIASHYNRTYVVDMRLYREQREKEFSFKMYVEDNNIDEVLFIGNINFFIHNDFVVE